MNKVSHLTQCELIEYASDDGKPLCRVLTYTDAESGAPMWELHVPVISKMDEDDGDCDFGMEPPSEMIQWEEITSGLGDPPSGDRIKYILDLYFIEYPGRD